MMDAAEKLKKAQGKAKAKVDETTVRKYRRLKDATAMGRLMHRSVSSLGLAKGATMSKVLAQWPQICPMFAPWSVPLDVKGGALRVAVAHDSIKRELQMHGPQLVAVVNQLLGYEGVQRLVAVVQSLPTARPKQANVLPQPAVSLDVAANACEHVKDDELKGALSRLGRWLMEPEATKTNKG